MNPAIKWAARLSHVREISLRGGADLSYWKDRIAPEGLLPLDRAGRAEILVIAADAKFRGVRFREVSFSVAVAAPDPTPGIETMFLLGAYNSNRFFAWCERTFFSTPYAHGDVAVTDVPPTIRLSRGGAPTFLASMPDGVPASAPRSAPGGLEARVLLPRRKGRPARFFFARITGNTSILPVTDYGLMLSTNPARDTPVLQALNDSNFVPTEWHIRLDATHAKSKTYSPN
jgi:hypothetical protein